MDNIKVFSIDWGSIRNIYFQWVKVFLNIRNITSVATLTTDVRHITVSCAEWKWKFYLIEHFYSCCREGGKLSLEGSKYYILNCSLLRKLLRRERYLQNGFRFQCQLWQHWFGQTYRLNECKYKWLVGLSTYSYVSYSFTEDLIVCYLIIIFYFILPEFNANDNSE